MTSTRRQVRHTTLIDPLVEQTFRHNCGCQELLGPKQDRHEAHLEWLLARVDPDVLLEVVLELERLSTFRTLELAQDVVGLADDPPNCRIRRRRLTRNVH